MQWGRFTDQWSIISWRGMLKAELRWLGSIIARLSEIRVLKICQKIFPTKNTNDKKNLMVSSSWVFLAFPFWGLAGMPSVWGWYIPKLTELMAPQLHGSQPIWLPSSWQSSLRFCRDLLWFSQKMFFEDSFFFKKSWHFFTPKGFFFMLPTWKAVLSEWGVSDWVKPLRFLLQCGTASPEKEFSWSLMSPGWCV